MILSNLKNRGKFDSYIGDNLINFKNLYIDALLCLKYLKSDILL